MDIFTIIIAIIIAVFVIKISLKYNNISKNWQQTTAKVVSMDKVVSNSNLCSLKIEYQVDYVTYYGIQNINKSILMKDGVLDCMGDLQYIDVYYNPKKPSEFSLANSIKHNSYIISLASTDESIFNMLNDNKRDVFRVNNNLGNNTAFLSIFLIPFIMAPIFSSWIVISTTQDDKAEYEYISKNWVYTTANVVNIDVDKYTDSDSDTHTTYTAIAEYMVNGTMYDCSKTVSGRNTKTVDIYYNPDNVSQYSELTEVQDDTTLFIFTFCAFWLLIVTVFIFQLKMPIRIIYLIIMYGGTIASIVYNMFIRSYTFIG